MTSLSGVVWDADAVSPDSEIPASAVREISESQRRVFKRARLDFQIVQKESDDQAKFDLFQRLNSGTRLSEQEARNCLAVMLDPSFSKWLDNLAAQDYYTTVVDITERKERESYGTENVLRYLACARTSIQELRKMGDFGEFLTDRMREFVTDSSFDRDQEAERFRFVFAILKEALGDKSFRRYYSDGDRFTGAFSVSAFEAITSGIARNYDFWKSVSEEDRPSIIRGRVKDVWQDETFGLRSGGGKSANRRIPYMVEVGERIFQG